MERMNEAEVGANADALVVDWDVPITMDDGTVLRADVFRPVAKGRYPVILSYGPYGKGLAFQDGYPAAWEGMVRSNPDVAEGSSGRYQNWETVDPEKWVCDGYVCVRVDSRGAGRSPGLLDPWSERESRDICEAIAWAAAQPWSSGKVGMNGISYYGMNQWFTASRRPPALAAICVWEGAADLYRDAVRHGGIPCTSLWKAWFEPQVRTVQHGVGERGARSRVTGELVAGTETLDEETLRSNRVDFAHELTSRSLRPDSYFETRAARWDAVDVPLLSAGNWGGLGLHLRGNTEGFMQAASKQKWLEMHGGDHWSSFYIASSVALQKRFFDHFLKGENNGWDAEPPVNLKIRHVDKFVERKEQTWPLPDTRWTRYYLEPGNAVLGTSVPVDNASVTYEGLGPGLVFMLPPSTSELEVTGPVSARLYVSFETTDADLFLTVRLFTPDMKEVTFQGANDPNTPITQGWLRASHRKLDAARSKPWRPWHSHDEIIPLVPGEIYPLDVEIWPTSIVVPPGYRLALSIRGKDFEYAGPPVIAQHPRHEMRGCGAFVHDDERDRLRSVFGGRVTIHTGPAHPSSILLPVIPPRA
ncbi:CocE/NonD family hydrolase [Variovorax guangxiensis]|uniref:CocE/NonD family hydrolase n=1 Tax=Variovorax guangxiensis TaxID=1775474 RepID=UPI00285423A5|nr:CocE/NonD family hydrolase [Variovorax guangxiensis]MDR6861412.1 putative acyl esterase [Variovorax guangxiensis]